MYRNMHALCLAGLRAAAGSAPAAAQTIYRCGDSYSQQPCPGGKEVQADDPRSAEPAVPDQRGGPARCQGGGCDGEGAAEGRSQAGAGDPAARQGRSRPSSRPRPAAAAAMAKKPAHFTAVSPAKKATAQPGKKKKKAKKKPAAV